MPRLLTPPEIAERRARALRIIAERTVRGIFMDDTAMAEAYALGVTVDDMTAAIESERRLARCKRKPIGKPSWFRRIASSITSILKRGKR